MALNKNFQVQGSIVVLRPCPLEVLLYVRLCDEEFHSDEVMPAHNILRLVNLSGSE